MKLPTLKWFILPALTMMLLLGADSFHVQGIEVAVDELDGLEESARRLALPHFAEAAAAEGLDQAVTRNGLRVWLPHDSH